MSYEDLEKARAQHAAKDATNETRKAEKKAKNAAKGIVSAMPGM